MLGTGERGGIMGRMPGAGDRAGDGRGPGAGDRGAMEGRAPGAGERASGTWERDGGIGLRRPAIGT